MTIPSAPGHPFSSHLTIGSTGPNRAYLLFCGIIAAILQPLCVILSSIQNTTQATYRALTHCTSRMFYGLRVSVLTIIAYLTGKSFIIPCRNALPHFIARLGNRNVHSFTLNLSLLQEIQVQTGGVPVSPTIRTWRTTPRVQSILAGSPLFNIPPRPTISILPRTLIGDRMTQERGLIGHEYCFALLEEYGEDPSGSGYVMSKAYSWKHGKAINVGLPYDFFLPPVNDENCGFDDSSVTIESIMFAEPAEFYSPFHYVYPAIIVPPEDHNGDNTTVDEDAPPEDSEELDGDEWDLDGTQMVERLREKQGSLAAVDLAIMV